MKMKKTGLQWLVTLSAAALVLTGCQSARTPDVFEQDTVTQVSSYNGLLAALFDGVVSYEELEPYGDFGLGTFDRMDGERVLLDGVLYQVDYDGNINGSPSKTGARAISDCYNAVG
jgi:hypothetical protein